MKISKKPFAIDFCMKKISFLQKKLKNIDDISRKLFDETVKVDSSDSLDGLYKLFRYAFFCVLIVFVVNLFSFGTSNFGEWGDFFGGVLNPLLTFLMFMGLLITIVLQQRELREAREQFTRSADALTEQKKISEQRAFETTFFNLVSVFNDVINQIDLVNKEGIKTIGRDCFSVFYTRLSKKYKYRYGKHKKSYDDILILNWSFDLFVKENEQKY